MWVIFKVESAPWSCGTGNDSEHSCFTGVLEEESISIPTSKIVQGIGMIMVSHEQYGR